MFIQDDLLTERIFAEVIAANGGRVFRVGGCVRDWFMGITPKDIDFCIVGMVRKNFKMLFPNAEEYGKYFPVFRLLIDGIKCEVAFARKERKEGSGYKGFKISSNPKISIEEDLFRRDTTINSIAIDSLTGKVIDPFQGIQDIKNKILRATSKHFSDDPIRALRLAGQAARLDFAIDNDTLVYASSVANELAEAPSERIIAELAKVLTEAQEPARFFNVLAETGLLQVTFKELWDLSSEKFKTIVTILDRVAKATKASKLRFAAFGLVLDRTSLSRWNLRMTLPGDWLDSAIVVSKLKEVLETPSPESLVDAVNVLKRSPLCVEEFDIIAMAAGLRLPTLVSLQAAMSSALHDVAIPSTIEGKAIGAWIRCKHIAAVTNLLETSATAAATDSNINAWQGVVNR